MHSFLALRPGKIIAITAIHMTNQDLHDPHTGSGTPTRKEVLNYLGQLAKEYHLPPKLVYAVADAESSVNPNVPPHPNYLQKGRQDRPR